MSMLGAAAGTRVRAAPVARPRRVPLGRLASALLVVASLLLLLPFGFPLWRYNLEAPQYPEGISMTIWANKLGGRMALVNGLNHYIGMKEIQAGSFPELALMPWIIGLLSLSGLAMALLRRRAALAAWLAALALFAVLGLADLYHWLYRFGHDLSPDAPIKVDPFTPPLIGPKTVMNFEVVTFPDIGGIAIVLALTLGALALVLEGRRRAAPG